MSHYSITHTPQYGEDKNVHSSTDINPNFISQFNLFLSNPHNRTPKMEQMISEYNNYIKQKQHSIENKTSITNPEYKQTFFNNLEQLLSDVIYLQNKELRKERIDSVYRWFSKKTKAHIDLAQLHNKTHSSPDQKLTPDELNINNKEYQDQKEEEYKLKHGPPSEHRTIIYNYGKPSEILKNDYRSKHIRPKKSHSVSYIPPQQTTNVPQSDNNGNIQAPIIPNQIISSYKDKDIFRSSIGMHSSFYSTAKTTANAFMNTTHSSLSQMNIKQSDYTKEIKSAYSYNRPEFSFKQLNVEQYVNSLKNKCISERRNMEEMKHYINEYGSKRGMFKANMQRRSEVKNIMNLYIKKLKDDDDLKEECDDIKEMDKLKEYFTKRKGMNRSLSTANANMFMKNKFKRKGSNRSDNDNNDIIDEDNDKVFTNNIKNINRDNIIIKNKNNEKVYTYKLKLNINDNKTTILRNKILKDDNDNLQLPNNLTAHTLINKNDNSILHARLLNAKINSLKTNGKYKHTYYNKQLSGYSLLNYKTFYNKRFLYENDRNEYSCCDMTDRSIGSYTKSNFDFDNYLHTRKIIANYKENEVKKIKASLSFTERKESRLKSESKEEGIEGYKSKKRSIDKKNEEKSPKMNNNSLENAFMMNESNVIYPRLFLPRNSSGLLNIPPDMLKAKKKKGKSKKKKK